ncbi:MAG TPA: hypothetical protein GX711_01470, partial [Clostridia bacterium]|nr:hypothetical protein [Clostridia bacterium]
KLLGEKALRIAAETPDEKEYTGEIVRITRGKEPTIRLKLSSKKDYDFNVTSDTRIYLGGDRVKLDELEAGLQARVVARGYDALRIEAESDLIQKYVGEIVGLVLGSNSSLTIETDNGRVYTFKIDSETVIYLEDTKGKISDLKLGQEVEVRAVDKRALRINIDED